MKINPTNVGVHIRAYFTIKVTKLLHVHVSTTLVSILREVLYTEYITRASKNISQI